MFSLGNADVKSQSINEWKYGGGFAYEKDEY